MTKTVGKKDLRNFGLIMGVMIALFFGLLLPWIWGFVPPIWLWILATAFVVVALLAPVALRPLFFIWLKIGHVLGWINTRIILGLVFAFIFIPVGIFFKLTGRDSMARKYRKDEASYRVVSRARAAKDLERPF